MATSVGRPRRVLNLDQLRALLAALLTTDGVEASLAALVVLTGQRAGSIASMDWKSIDLDRREWRMPRKGAAPWRLPIPTIGFSLMLAASGGVRPDGAVLLRGGRPIDLTRCRKWLEGRLPAGLVDWSHPELRRSVLAAMVDAGLSFEIVGEIAGRRTLAREDPRWTRRALRSALDDWARALADTTS